MRKLAALAEDLAGTLLEELGRVLIGDAARRRKRT